MAGSDCLLPALTDSSVRSTNHTTDDPTDGVAVAGSLTIKAVSARAIVRLFESIEMTAPHGSLVLEAEVEVEAKAKGKGKAATVSRVAGRASGGRASGKASGKAESAAYGGAAVGGESGSSDLSTEISTDDPSHELPFGLTDMNPSPSSIERVAAFAIAWVDSATESNIRDLIDSLSDAQAMLTNTVTATSTFQPHPDAGTSASISTSSLSSATHAHAVLLAGQRLASVLVRGLIASHKQHDHHTNLGTATKRCEVTTAMLHAMIGPASSGQVCLVARARVTVEMRLRL